MDNNFNNTPSSQEEGSSVVIPKPPRSKLVDIAIAVLKSIGYVGIWLGVQTILVLAFTLVITFANPYMNSDEVLNFVNSLSMELTLATNLITLAIFILIFKIASKSFLSKIQASLPHKKSILPTAVVGVSAQFTTLFVLGIIINMLPKSWVESFEQNSEIINDANQVVVFIVAVILAPIFEEIMCRGLILNSLRKAMPKWCAIVLSSLIFGVIHGNAIQIIYATALGILLGWIYTKTDSIYIPMLCHFAFNLTSTLLQYVNTENEVIAVILSLVMLISIPITTLCIVYFCLKSFTKPKEKLEVPVYVPITPINEYNLEALEKIQAEINDENGDNK